MARFVDGLLHIERTKSTVTGKETVQVYETPGPDITIRDSETGYAFKNDSVGGVLGNILLGEVVTKRGPVRKI